jgi:hypothetical protein
MKCSNRTILNLCRIVVAILKMATTRNVSMSAIYSGYHTLSTYEMWMKSDNVEFMRYCTGILKMATARNFSMSGINSGHHNLPTYEMSLKSDNFEKAELLL